MIYLQVPENLFPVNCWGRGFLFIESFFCECMNRGNLFNLFYHFRTLQSGRMINYREEEKRILDEILGKGVYDNRIRPSGTNGTGEI